MKSEREFFLLGVAVLIGTMSVGCVPKSKHETLASEFNSMVEAKSKLGEKVDELTMRLVEMDKEKQAMVEASKDAAELAAKQAKDEVEAQLREKEAELESLRKEFERFKETRRTGMIDRKYPLLVVKNLRMTDAVIKGVTASTVKFSHSGGISSVRLADLNGDMQWEAVWTREEAEAYEMGEKATNASAAQASQAAKTANEIMIAIKNKGKTEQRVEELEKLVPTLEQLVDARRQDLGNAFQKLAQEHKVLADKWNDWDDERPEASPLLTNWQKRPALQGLRELDALADGVKAAQKQGSAAVQELNRLKEALRSTN
jgi:hypothetical protein